MHGAKVHREAAKVKRLKKNGGPEEPPLESSPSGSA